MAILGWSIGRDFELINNSSDSFFFSNGKDCYSRGPVAVEVEFDFKFLDFSRHDFFS